MKIPQFQVSVCVAALLCSGVLSAKEPQPATQLKRDGFTFTTRDLAPPVHRAGMFFGQSGNALIVGGGYDESRKPSSEVFVCSGTSWRKFTLKEAVAFAGYASAKFSDKSGQLFVVGGVSTTGITRTVQVLQWSGAELLQTALPNLLAPVAMAGVGIFEDQTEKQLYVACGTTSPDATSASSRLFRYALDAKPGANWEELPPLPGPGRLLPGVICFYNDVHVLGGFTVGSDGGKCVLAPSSDAAAFRWKAIDGTSFKGWRKLVPLPEPVAAPILFMTGQVHAALAGGFSQPVTGNFIGGEGSPPASTGLNVYHNVTDTWVNKGSLPVPVAAGAVLRAGDVQTMVGLTQNGGLVAFDVALKRMVKTLRWPDYVALLGYFVIVAVVGVSFSGKQTRGDQYALGDRKIPWWMAGISMFAAAASSISFMAIPAQAFRTSLLWALPALVLIPMFFLEAYVLYPLIRRLEITSTFEYLERRFHPSLRFIASAQAMALQTFGRMNMVLLLPALAISAVTGLSIYVSVLLMGVVTTIYTAKGGMKAVVLTEVIQGLTMVVGISLIVILAITGLPGGWKSFVEVGTRFHKFDLAIWSPDLAMPAIWFLVLTPFLNKLAFSADQPVVQRVFATPLKDVRKLALMFLCFSVFISFAVNFAGISVFAYFHQHPNQLDPSMTNDQVIPLYIVQRLPMGVAGLIIASLFAAAMSALAGGMNSVAILFTEDFYRKLRTDASDRERLLVMRLASMVAGALATGCALYMASMNQRSLFQIWNELFALLGGGFLGIYILGSYTRRANAIGAFSGAIFSIGFTVWLKTCTPVHWCMYMPGGVISCVVFGYVVSLLTPPSKHSLAGLTVFDMRQPPAGNPAETAGKAVG